MQAITFDATGTLITTTRPVGETYAQIARSFGCELAVDALSRGFATVFPRMPTLAFPGKSPGDIPSLEREWWHNLVSQVIDHAGGIDDFGPFFDALYEHFARGGAWLAYPEVPEVLEQLKSDGYRLGVISNFDSRLENILRALEIDHYFDVVVYSSVAGAAKPDPAIFATALHALSVAPHDTVHVGDRPGTDLQGAHAAGLHALLVDRNSRPTPHAGAGHGSPVISSLRELPEHL